MKKFFVIIIILVIGAVLISQKNTTNKTNYSLSLKITPTITPFYEMTIPYFRGRNYNSKIGELIKIADNSSYTSYLTSYQSDEYKINALLTIPDGKVPDGGWPAIVFVHGYIPPAEYQTQSKYIAYVDYLAKNGFVVFKIDLRGHGESEGEADGAYFSGGYVIDTLNAYSALQSFDKVNSSRIGIWGHSMAGNIILRSIVAKPIPAVVIWAGAVYSYDDMKDYGIRDSSYHPSPNNSERQKRRDKLFQVHGQFNSENAFWKSVVATNYLDNIKVAIQIDHAVNDDVVSIEYSRNLTKLLEKAGVRYEFNEFPSGGHNIEGINFGLAMRKTVEFFKKYL